MLTLSSVSPPPMGGESCKIIENQLFSCKKDSYMILLVENINYAFFNVKNTR